jgi:putative ABC transport system permease protein
MLASDLKYGLRILRRTPFSTVACVLTLALGIGACGAVFSVLNALLLRPLPFPEFKQLVVVPQIDVRDGSRTGTSMSDLIAYKSGVESFRFIAGYSKSTFTLRVDTLPEQIQGSLVTAEFFQALGVTAARGRAFSPADPDGAVVLSYSAWEGLFHGDEGIIGTSVLLDGLSVDVVGVMPAGFWYPEREVRLWRLLAPDSHLLRDSEDLHFLRMIGRLRQMETLQQAKAELDVVNSRLAKTRPDMNSNLGIAVIPMADHVIGNLRPALLVMMLAAAFVLFMACGNVANLQLSQSIHRTREFAIRVAHGATLGRILRQQLLESLLVSTIAGTFGLGLAVALLRLVLKFNPSAYPRGEEIGLDLRILAFTLILSVLVGVLSSLASVLQTCSTDLLGRLNSHGDKLTGGKRTRSFQYFLIICEVAAALVLLIGVSLMTRSFMRLSSVDVGFVADRLLAISIRFPKATYPDRDRLEGARKQVYACMLELPGVESAAVTSDLPLVRTFENFFSIRGKEVVPRNIEMVAQASIDPGYFKKLGIQVKEGREFTEFDRPNTQRVAIVNESMARRFWHNGTPIGSQIRHGLPEEKTQWYIVVGIVKDIPPAIAYQPLPTVFTPFSQIPQGYDDVLSRSVTILVRAKRDNTANLALDVRRAVSRVDPNLGSDIRGVDQIVSDSLVQPSFRAVMSCILGAVAFSLSMVGIYGVISTATARETRDIGIRLALGANRGDVLKLAITRGMISVAIGLTLGLGISLFLARFVGGLLFGVSATDPESIIGAVVVLACASLVAICFPAHTATRVDPAIALRHH